MPSCSQSPCLDQFNTHFRYVLSLSLSLSLFYFIFLNYNTLLQRRQSLSVYNFVVLGLSCSMWDLVPWPEIEPRPPPLGVWSLNPWATRKIPWSPSFLPLCFPQGWLQTLLQVSTLLFLPLSSSSSSVSLASSSPLLKWAPRWGPSCFDTIYFSSTIHPPTDVKMPKSVS